MSDMPSSPESTVEKIRLSDIIIANLLEPGFSKEVKEAKFRVAGLIMVTDKNLPLVIAHENPKDAESGVAHIQCPDESALSVITKILQKRKK